VNSPLGAVVREWIALKYGFLAIRPGSSIHAYAPRNRRTSLGWNPIFLKMRWNTWKSWKTTLYRPLTRSFCVDAFRLALESVLLESETKGERPSKLNGWKDIPYAHEIWKTCIYAVPINIGKWHLKPWSEYPASAMGKKIFFARNRTLNYWWKHIGQGVDSLKWRWKHNITTGRFLNYYFTTYPLLIILRKIY